MVFCPSLAPSVRRFSAHRAGAPSQCFPSSLPPASSSLSCFACSSLGGRRSGGGGWLHLQRPLLCFVTKPAAPPPSASTFPPCCSYCSGGFCPAPCAPLPRALWASARRLVRPARPRLPHQIAHLAHLPFSALSLLRVQQFGGRGGWCKGEVAPTAPPCLLCFTAGPAALGGRVEWWELWEWREELLPLPLAFPSLSLLRVQQWGGEFGVAGVSCQRSTGDPRLILGCRPSSSLSHCRTCRCGGEGKGVADFGPPCEGLSRDHRGWGRRWRKGGGEGVRYQGAVDKGVARYSSPATAALGRLLLPYLFPELSAFATNEDLVSHLRARDARYRTALPAEFLDRDHFLSLDPTSLTVDLHEQHLLAAETSTVAIGATRGTPRTPFFEGCSPSPLAPSYASAANLDVLSTEVVGAASASAKRCSNKAKGGRGGGGGSGSGGGGSSGGGGHSGGGGSGGSDGGSGSVGGGSGGSGGSGGAGQTCGKAHTQHRLFSRLDDAWRAEFGDEVERPTGQSCLGIDVAALGASESVLPEALHTFTLDSGASHCFFRDSTTLTPLPAPVPVRLADPSGGPVVARSSTTLPCPAVPSSSLSGLHLPSFSTNLVSTTALQDAMVTTTTPGGHRVLICTCTRTGRHLATFTHRPGSSLLYTLATEPPQVAASAQVSASGQVAPPCSCPLLSHQTLLWHHRLGHPSLPCLRGMHSRLLVSGLPRSLPPLPPSPASPCLPCVEGRQRTAPHSSSFPPTTYPLQTLHMDVWGPAHVSGQGRKCYFLLVVDDYTRYTTVFPLSSKGQVVDVLIPWIRAVRLRLRERFRVDLHVLRLHFDRGAPHWLIHGGRSYLHDPCGCSPFSVAVCGPVRCASAQPLAPCLLPGDLAYTGLDGEGWRCAVFRVWGSRAFVRGTSTDKLSARAIPCVFLGFTPNAHGCQFYHPTSRRVFPSQDIKFDESIPFNCLFLYRSAPPPPPPLFLAPGPPPVDPLLPQGPAPSGVSQVDPLPSSALVEVAVGSGATRGAASRGAASGGAETGVAESEGAGSGGAEPGGAEPGGAEPAGVEPGGAEPKGVEPGGAESEGAESGGAEPQGAASSGGSAGASPRLSLQQLHEWLIWRARLRSGATGAGGAGVTAASGPGGARTRGTGASGSYGFGGAGDGDPMESGAAGGGGSGAAGTDAGGAGVGGSGARGAGAGGAGGVDTSGTVRPRSYSVPLLQQSPVSPVRTARRIPCSRPPPVADTHAMALRPSSIPLRVPLPAPPESSPSAVPESDRACATSPTVSRLLTTSVIDPSFESAASSALVPELLDFAAAFLLDYATALVAESASASPPVVGVPLSRANIVDGMWIFREVDYFQTFSPTPKMTTLQVLLHVAFQHDYELHSLDFSTASLRGSLHEEIWMHHPPGFTWSFPAGTQWSLRRPVYGLRQAPREWHDTLRTTLAALGFARSTADPSLFLRTDTLLPPFYILVYVNDLVFATVDTEALTLVKSELQKRQTCTDLGELSIYLGLQITRDRARRTITLTQSHMVHQVLQRFGFQFSSPQPTPLSTSHSLSAPPSDESVEPSGPYPELVGFLMYLMTCTRPDLANPLSLLARYVASVRRAWGLCLEDGVQFSSLVTQTLLGSSCEAEIYAGAMAASEIRWLTYLLTDFGEKPRSPPQRGQLCLAYVATGANTADVFTKALLPGDNQRFSTVLGLVPTLPHLLTA
ncbi:unnamed protein product [Closterium sp. NIES-53]